MTPPKRASVASLAQQGDAELRWSVDGERVRIEVRDEGLGLSSWEKLFVPFFTTKPSAWCLPDRSSKRTAAG